MLANLNTTTTTNTTKKLAKLLTYSQTQANEAKAWFMAFTISGQEKDRIYSISPGAHTTLQLLRKHLSSRCLPDSPKLGFRVRG